MLSFPPLGLKYSLKRVLNGPVNRSTDLHSDTVNSYYLLHTKLFNTYLLICIISNVLCKLDRQF